MQTRLLSFLSDLEHFLRAERPNPRAGVAWELGRSVNYGRGLAQLRLAERGGASAARPAGTIWLQAFELADGSTGLKTTLGWQDAPSEGCEAVYPHPSIDWTAEAQRLAKVWLAGPTSVALGVPLELAAVG